MTETHTYPDGSQRVGCPPFPELSPLEQDALAKRGEPADGAEEVAQDTPKPKPKAKPGPKPKAAQE